jgi:hypothetical protein
VREAVTAPDPQASMTTFRRQRRVNRRLAIYQVILGLGWLAAGLAGLATSKDGLAVLGFPLAAFFFVMAWVLYPSGRSRPFIEWIARRQARLFSRLGIKWLSGPDSAHEVEQRSKN